MAWVVCVGGDSTAWDGPGPQEADGSNAGFRVTCVAQDGGRFQNVRVIGILPREPNLGCLDPDAAAFPWWHLCPRCRALLQVCAWHHLATGGPIYPLHPH